MCFLPSPYLAVLASCRESGLVVDCGFGETRATAVFSNTVVLATLACSSIAGRAVIAAAAPSVREALDTAVSTCGGSVSPATGASSADGTVAPVAAAPVGPATPGARDAAEVAAAVAWPSWTYVEDVIARAGFVAPMDARVSVCGLSQRRGGERDEREEGAEGNVCVSRGRGRGWWRHTVDPVSCSRRRIRRSLCAATTSSCRRIPVCAMCLEWRC